MRLTQLLNERPKARFTQSDLIHVFKEIDTGQGGIAELAQRKPVVQEMSQEFLRQIAGETFPVYRALMIHEGEELLEESIVSTSLDLKEAIYISRTTKTRGFSKAEHTLLKYEIDLSRVLAYVPALLQNAKTMIKNFDTRNIRSERTWRMVDIKTLFKAGMDEKEVVADVSGLEPIVVSFPNHANGMDNLGAFEDGVHDRVGKFTDVNKFKEWFRDRYYNTFPDDSWEAAMDRHNAIMDKVETFKGK